MRSTAVPLALAAFTALASARAQTPTPTPAPTPDSLARLVLQRFVAGTPEAFDSVDPDPLGRAVVRAAVDRHLTRDAGLARVLSVSADRAVLLISATVREAAAPTSVEAGGDQVNRTRRFSGLYLATRGAGGWAVARRMPLDSANAIRAQTIHVALVPGQTTTIRDTLTIDVGTPSGFAARLNTMAELHTVTVDGANTDHVFGGGILWIAASPRRGHRLVIDYAIPTPRDTAGGAPAVPSFGALHNTDAWHPFFDYDTWRDLGTLTVTATIPATYRLTTTFPQTEHVDAGLRTVVGRTAYPTSHFALMYDTDWRPVVRTIGSIRLETFTTPAFPFSTDTMAAILEREYHLLTARFGEPRGATHYFAVVEDRALGHVGFAVRINDAIVSGDHAMMLDDLAVGPSYPFAHEISHLWTMNATGLAANLLREGWATYAEATMLGATYGPAVEQAFWERNATAYFAGDRFEGKQSILGNPDNGRIHYTKGSWLLHSLDRALGDSAFDRGMRAYIARCGYGPDGYEELIAAMSRAAGRDMHAFIMPWLTEQYVPDVDAEIVGSRLVVAQRQPGAVFDLPLTVALHTASGDVTRTVHLTTRTDTIDVGTIGPITGVHVDPNHDFLLRRHWGELARFELVAPDAKKVALALSTTPPAPATRQGDRWTVTLPLPEGRYVFLWQVDGTAPSDDATIAAIRAARAGGDDPTARAGVRTVRPLQRLEDLTNAK
jgi:hypothetical protein